MKGIIDFAARLVRAGRLAYTKKWSFLLLSAIVFFGSVAVLGTLDLLPETSPRIDAKENKFGATSARIQSQTAAELPTKIEIPKINLSATVVNPATTDVAILDRELLKGAVHYPTSASLGETGNVVLFGHSSYLPIVKNQAYKIFNGIQKLVAGDVITVYSSSAAYTYRVRGVASESANDATIPLSISGKVLTLSTCDSFGAKTDRFVVVADFVGSHLISI